jgi:hypothetical protein
MNKTTTTLATIYSLATNARYNYEGKEKFRKAAISFLRALAKRLNLSKNSFTIRFNPGGIACEGDPILHHDKFYVNLAPGSMGRGYWRTCAGQKDYSGDSNRCASPSYTVESFAAEISQVALNSAK